MKALSASEAVWPAVERTVSYLFRPFKWWRFLKLAAIGVVTEGTVVSLRFSLPHLSFDDGSVSADLNSLLRPEYLPVTILAGIAALVAVLLAYVLLMQLRFAFFRALMNDSGLIAEEWRGCRLQAERYSRASLTVWLALLGMVALFAVGVLVVAFVVFTARTPDGKLDPGVFLILFFPCVGFGALVVITAVAAEVVMHDFILPQMALEDVTFRQAWTRLRLQIWSHRETFFSYFVLRLLLPLLAEVVLVIAGAIVLPLVFAIVGMSAAGINAFFEQATSAAEWFTISLRVLFAVLGAALGAVAAAILGGPVGVFIRNYALVFYGGHYTALGDSLKTSHKQSDMPQGLKTA